MASLGKRGRVQRTISILDADLYSCKNLIETFLKKSEAQKWNFFIPEQRCIESNGF